MSSEILSAAELFARAARERSAADAEYAAEVERLATERRAADHTVAVRRKAIEDAHAAELDRRANVIAADVRAMLDPLAAAYSTEPSRSCALKIGLAFKALDERTRRELGEPLLPLAVVLAFAALEVQRRPMSVVTLAFPASRHVEAAGAFANAVKLGLGGPLEDALERIELAVGTNNYEAEIDATEPRARFDVLRSAPTNSTMTRRVELFEKVQAAIKLEAFKRDVAARNLARGDADDGSVPARLMLL